MDLSIYPSLRILRSDLAKHKLTWLRNRDADRATFRRVMLELGMMLTMEATRDIRTSPFSGTTSAGEAFDGQVIDQSSIVAISILRTGLIMGDAFLEMIPFARIGHIGIYHDYEKAKITNYMAFLPQLPEDPNSDLYYILDGLIGTSESIKIVSDALLDVGINPQNIQVIALTISEMGVREFCGSEKYNNILVHCADVESGVDGDFPAFTLNHIADRLFGTDGLELRKN